MSFLLGKLNPVVGLNGFNMCLSIFEKNFFPNSILKKFGAVFERKLRGDLFFNGVALDEIEQYYPLSKYYSPCLTIKKRIDSKIDGATKTVFETSDGYLIESVILRIASGRTTLCISTQVGCARQCKFCATGNMGLKRNLTFEEILEQVLAIRRILRKEGRDLRNLVFMGMGEPMDNLENVKRALNFLTSDKYCRISDSRITVSTIGVEKGFRELMNSFPKINIAVSLHAMDDETRNKLMPCNIEMGLDKLKILMMDYNQNSDNEVFVEYIMFKNMNDTVDAAGKLIKYLKGVKVKVNLIPFNQIDSNHTLQASDEDTILRFQQILQDARLLVTRRYSLGGDIAGACGQLLSDIN